MTILLVVGLCGLLATSAWAGQPRKLGPSPMFMAPLQDRNSTAGNNATVARSPFLSIEPSDVLNWVPCSPRNASRIAEGRIDCARLLVPIDYSNPDSSAGGQFALAVIRIRADNGTSYRGPLFLNFGGPGGSGTEALPSLPASQIGPLLAQGYDLVSWDPRAVGSTFPAVACFASQTSRTLWTTRADNQWLLRGNDSFLQQNAELQVLAQGCSQYSGSRLLPYVGTVPTARDLERLVELYGHSRKLSYFGFSYGTLLGATFASMFPNQVERMILDAVVEPTEWYQNGLAGANIRDADNILEDFFTRCFQAGPERCAFHFDSPSQIRDAFFEIERRVFERPIPVGSRFVLNADRWRDLIFYALYLPRQSFPVLATGLALAYNNSLPLLTNTTAIFPEPPFSSFPVDPETGRNNGLENAWLISCSDHPRPPFDDEQGLSAYIDRVSKGGMFARRVANRFALGCARLDLGPRDRFNGSFTDVRTASPILFITTFYDPITPLSSAISTSAGFVGSSILISNVTGHTTFYNPSSCVSDNVVRYLQNATLPTNGTICQPDILPFNLYPNGTLAPEDLFPVDQ